MTDYKGFGSNAHIWARLKHPDLLRTYLKIAARLGLKMYLPPGLLRAYSEIATKLKVPMQRSNDSLEYDPKKSYVEWIVSPFFIPWNNPTNITTARDMIAKHLSENNLRLQDYTDYDDLNPITNAYANESENWREWVNARYGGLLHSNFTRLPTMASSSDYGLQRRGILKNYRTIRDSDLSTDFEDIENPIVKYKPSWQRSEYVSRATDRYNLRSVQVERPILSAELDDIWNDCEFDEKIA
jgi:hypothetical protein